MATKAKRGVRESQLRATREAAFKRNTKVRKAKNRNTPTARVCSKCGQAQQNA